jgi:hypothetical protein
VLAGNPLRVEGVISPGFAAIVIVAWRSFFGASLTSTSSVRAAVRAG